MPLGNIAIWKVERAEFAEWRSFTGTPQIANYEQYLARLDEIAAECRQRDYVPVFVPMPVAEMRQRLAEAKLRNTSANRARIIAADKPTGYALGVKEQHRTMHPRLQAEGVLGWAVIEIAGKVTASGVSSSITEALRNVKR